MTPFDEIVRRTCPFADAEWHKSGKMRCLHCETSIREMEAVMQATQKHVMERYWNDVDNCPGPCPYCFENKFDLPECQADIARRTEEILKK